MENVNEFPVFSPDVYNITVPENQTLNTEILKVNVVDPDDGKNIPAFELKEVTAECEYDVYKVELIPFQFLQLRQSFRYFLSSLIFKRMNKKEYKLCRSCNKNIFAVW